MSNQIRTFIGQRQMGLGSGGIKKTRKKEDVKDIFKKKKKGKKKK